VQASRRSLLGLVALVMAVSAVSQWWAGRHDAALGPQLAALARPGDIHMVSSTTCAYCTVARQFLQRHGVAFSECFIERDAACAAQFAAARAPGTPLLLVRGRPMVGFDAQRIQATLARGG